MAPKLRDLKGMPFQTSPSVFGEGCFLKAELLLRSAVEHWRSVKALGKNPESATHADGIIGHFTISDGRKAKIQLDDGLSFLSVFEAKMYSDFSKGTTYAKDYNQISRTCACLIQMLKGKKISPDAEIHVVVIHPEDHRKMFDSPSLRITTTREEIKRRIAEHNPSTWDGYDWDVMLTVYKSTLFTGNRFWIPLKMKT